jgi:transcriptional regulator with XRE-family HTH domain
MTLANRVRDLRKQKGYSQSELGKLVGNVPYQSIQNLESGKVTNPRYILELSKILDVSIDYLFHGTTSDDTGIVKSNKGSLLTTDQPVKMDESKKMYVISINKNMSLALSSDIEIVAQVTDIYNKNIL